MRWYRIVLHRNVYSILCLVYTLEMTYVLMLHLSKNMKFFMICNLFRSFFYLFVLVLGWVLVWFFYSFNSELYVITQTAGNKDSRGKSLAYFSDGFKILMKAKLSNKLFPQQHSIRFYLLNRYFCVSFDVKWNSRVLKVQICKFYYPVMDSFRLVLYLFVIINLIRHSHYEINKRTTLESTHHPTTFFTHNTHTTLPQL